MMLARIVASVALITAPAAAELVRVDIRERAPVASGYERIVGIAHFAVDPKLPQNRNIADIERAAKNTAGRVEFSADLYILAPADPARGNQTVLFEVVNRGGKGMLGMFNRARGSQDPRTAEDFGDGLLMNEGYTLVWLGWQHDVPRRPELMRMTVPVARGVSGLVRAEYTPDSAVHRIPLGDSRHVPYEVANARRVRVNVRDNPHAEPQPLARSEWRVDRDAGEIVTTRPLVPGKVYEVVYPSRDPPLAGLGPAGIRDLISDLRHGHVIGRRLRRAIAYGSSQSGVLLRGFVHEGFNADEKNRQVFDGMLVHIAGGRRSVFGRFAQASRTAGPLRNGTWSGTDQFPYSDTTQTDPASGVADGLLRRAIATRTVPKIFYTNSSYEYWGSAASLIHTTPDSAADVAPPTSTRIYLFAGGQHGPAPFPPARGRTQHLANPNDYRWTMRALLIAMNDWISGRREPPASAYPTIAGQTLVRRELLGFPNLGARPPLPYMPRHESGFRIPLVPQVDADGNEVAGIRMPEVAVPVATYTGWNPRSAAVGASDTLAANYGAFFPFPFKPEARDPRRAVQARYPSSEVWLRRVRTAAQELVTRRYLLEQDAQATVEAAAARWQWIASGAGR
jgi:hypothetical protein